jgi:hypothetical protein
LQALQFAPFLPALQPALVLLQGGSRQSVVSQFGREHPATCAVHSDQQVISDPQQETQQFPIQVVHLLSSGQLS